MPLSFWIRRFITVYIGIFAVLFAVGLMKGRSLRQVARESAMWSAAATSLFVATRLYYLSKGRRCELCKDAPEDAPPLGAAGAGREVDRGGERPRDR